MRYFGWFLFLFFLSPLHPDGKTWEKMNFWTMGLQRCCKEAQEEEEETPPPPLKLPFTHTLTNVINTHGEH